MTENEISRIVYEAAIEVHKALGGPGLLESVYEESLACELGLRGLAVQRQVEVPLVYKDITLENKLKIDILVNNSVIIECKATTEYNKIFESQTYTYLKLTGLKLGMVINFGEPLVKNGIHRVVNHL
jgi:GxxExxY protein